MKGDGPRRIWPFVVMMSLVLGGLITVGWLCAPMIVDFDVSGKTKPTASARLTAIASVRQMILWIAGGIIAVVTLTFTLARDRIGRAKLDIDRQANVSTRYTAAVAQLSDSESLTIRIAGVSALERLATQSPDESQSIIDVLAGFLREQPAAPELNDANPYIPGDANAAAVALGRITKLSPPSNPPDLRGVNLRWVDLSGANLDGANIEAASFHGARLTDATFRGARANATDFSATDARRASFEGIIAGFLRRGREEHPATFHQADVRGANFTNAIGLGPQYFYKAEADDTTIWTGTGLGPQPVPATPKRSTVILRRMRERASAVLARFFDEDGK